jgi:hypothetical protein
MHAVLEWFIVLLVIAAGLAVDRFAPAKNIRYPLYIAVLLTAFIFDLNKFSFRVAALNAVFYFAILLIVTEVFWICVRKKSKLLLGGAFVLLVPVFLYAFAAFLLIVPLPCHKNTGGRVGAYKACAGKSYALAKRLSFDPFNPAQVYILTRDLPHTPLKKQVDKFIAPKGYIEAVFSPDWQCQEGGRAKVDLYIDGYVLWSLEDKKAEE